jgi:hypothetical protein|tara:strand:+ start:933 stop:1406 length:474 start_codon:yes stop_codon:yes gene_type:complete
MVTQCINHLKKKKYELNIPSKVSYYNGKKMLKLSPSKFAKKVLKIKQSGVRCKGGKNLIHIGLHYFQFKEGPGEDIEYKSYRDDSTIGNMYCQNNYQRLLITIAHEVSHHIQYKYCPRVDRFKTNYRKAHGECFKTIYRYLRRDLINPMIEDQNKIN